MFTGAFDAAGILARTTPLDEIKHKTDGLSLFYTELDRSRAEIRPIQKLGRHAVDSNKLPSPPARPPS